MAKIVERRRIHCPIKHEGGFVLKKSNGSVIIKCPRLKECGDSCPYLRDPGYKSPFKRTPEFRPK